MKVENNLSYKVKRLCLLFGNDTELLLCKLSALRAQCKTNLDAAALDALIRNIKGLI